MKKNVEQDIAGLIIKVQEQLGALEKKIDTLIDQASTRPFEAKHDSKPFQRFDRPGHHGEDRQSNAYRERIMHKAICAECSKECEVPFRPAGDRPVYCKDCFSKRKTGGSFKGNNDNRRAEPESSQEHPFHKHRGGEYRRPYEKKKRVPKKRKK